MTGKTALLTLAFFLSLLTSVDSYSQAPKATPALPNKPAKVEALDLDRTELAVTCSGDAKTQGNCAGDPVINVSTKAIDPEGDTLVYRYTVTGGRVVGSGADVMWDLSGVKPGKYTITVGTDDGCGVCGNTMTKEVTVQAGGADPEIESITLDKTSVTLWCPLSGLPEDLNNCPKYKENVKVSVSAKSAQSPDLIYYYIVTGGKIIGKGANVIWDFEDTYSGKYELTVGVGKDNVIFGNIMSKTIQVQECPNCDFPHCECPQITISGPNGPIKPGSSIMFEARVEGGVKTSPIYKWTISHGEIITGQGKPQIIVKTPPGIVGEFTAILEVENICTDCPNKISKIVMFKEK
jgi:hypothetical protein